MSHASEVLHELLVESQTRAPPQATRRSIHVPSVAGKTIAVIGPRRAGKTTFLWQRLEERHAAGVPREHLLYLNFEDDRFEALDASHLRGLLEDFHRRAPALRASDTRGAWFLDEVHLVQGWETFVRRVMDSEPLDITVSGSSAKLLSREVATSLRGRAMEALVLPFSFREFLRHHGEEPTPAPESWTRAERTRIEHSLGLWLTAGGYPEAQGLEPRDRAELLRSYVDVAVLRDVIDRHNVTNPMALRWLVRQLLSSAGGGFTVHKFTNDLRSQGLPVGKDTLHGYISHLQDAFLIRTVPLATDSERRRMVNPRKCYPVDPALTPLYDRSGKANTGHALETAVLLELDRRGAETSYVKTQGGFEVDFLARFPEGGQSLIQVCARSGSRGTEEREFRALLAAHTEYPAASLQILTLAPETFRSEHQDVEILSAARWFLQR